MIPLFRNSIYIFKFLNLKKYPNIFVVVVVGAVVVALSPAVARFLTCITDRPAQKNSIIESITPDESGQYTPGTCLSLFLLFFNPLSSFFKFAFFLFFKKKN